MFRVETFGFRDTMLNGPQGGPHCLHSGGSPDGGAATGAFKVAVGFTKWI